MNKNLLLIPYILTVMILASINAYNLYNGQQLPDKISLSLSLFYRIIMAIFGMLYIIVSADIMNYKSSKLYEFSKVLFWISYGMFVVGFLLSTIFSPTSQNFSLIMPLMAKVLFNTK